MLSINGKTPVDIPHIKRKRESFLDHTYIAWVECRFRGAWKIEDEVNYIAQGSGCYVDLVDLSETRKRITFKHRAIVNRLQNIISYDEDDLENTKIL